MADEAKTLDQFYTKSSVAQDCVDLALDYASKLGYDLSKLKALEPSAGSGSFVHALQNKGVKVDGYDIAPKDRLVKTLDFLNSDISKPGARSNLIVIGNPPFGKRAKLAIDFINKAFDYSDTVIFILPLQFYKHSAQSKLNQDARLVYSAKLPEKSFTFLGEDYGVRCCIQVWTLRPQEVDLRLRSSPVTKHDDFDMWQYNNTRQAEKYFDKAYYDWDFAVPRQGYKDYSHKQIDPDKMDRRTQWIFFKAYTPQVLANLKQLDFHKLSLKNTSTPGFGKADVIEEYQMLFGAQPRLGSSTATQTFQLDGPSPSFAEALSPLPNL